VKSLPLKDNRVIAFSTHGLVSGERDLVEPALVLTPPRQGTDMMMACSRRAWSYSLSLMRSG